MHVKKVSIPLFIMVLSSIGFCLPLKKTGKPLPKPVPTSWSSDLLCW
jgi:hypothetical protein